ncbi:MAG TPA: GIY-YIG nuclease family protein [bacterium]|nr:GIY-YIG nuclease family protein [bacterium]
MFFAYAIYNQIRDKIYIGYTSDLEKRLKRHNSELPNKKTSFTRLNSGYWQLIHKEGSPTRQEAILREKKLKTFQGRKFIRNIIDKKYKN